LLAFGASALPAACTFGLHQQFAQRDAKAIGHLFRDVEPQTNFAEFDGADVGPMNSRSSRQGFLGNAACFSARADNSTKGFAGSVGHVEYFCALQTGCLQMSVCKEPPTNLARM
jgi:hypothetical protein